LEKNNRDSSKIPVNGKIAKIFLLKWFALLKYLQPLNSLKVNNGHLCIYFYSEWNNK